MSRLTSSLMTLFLVFVFIASISISTAAAAEISSFPVDRRSRIRGGTTDNYNIDRNVLRSLQEVTPPDEPPLEETPTKSKKGKEKSKKKDKVKDPPPPEAEEEDVVEDVIIIDETTTTFSPTEEVTECLSIAEAICGLGPNYRMMCNRMYDQRIITPEFSAELEDGNWTVFVPDNDAFRVANPALQLLTREELNRIYFFHFYRDDGSLTYEELTCQSKLTSVTAEFGLAPSSPDDTSRTKCNKTSSGSPGLPVSSQVPPVEIKYQSGLGNTATGTEPIVSGPEGDAPVDVPFCNGIIQTIRGSLMFPVPLPELDILITTDSPTYDPTVYTPAPVYVYPTYSPTILSASPSVSSDPTYAPTELPVRPPYPTYAPTELPVRPTYSPTKIPVATPYRTRQPTKSPIQKTLSPTDSPTRPSSAPSMERTLDVTVNITFAQGQER